MSTREDREWDAERDRAWVCRECGRDDANCDCEPEQTVLELIEAATGLNGDTLLGNLREFGLDIIRTEEPA